LKNKKYKPFINQLQELKEIEVTCKRYTEWSQSEFEADLWLSVRNKIKNLIKYYEADK
tara:strand:- start:264 stop:437 length:174 start_codon:yes stop_codon:yes gene_type:complete